MRSLIVSLLALASLATATAASSSESRVPAYYRTGTLATTWGELPTYSPTPQPFTLRIERPDPNLSGEAVVDLLVSRDGRVKDWHVVSSPDNPAFQRGVAPWLRGARIGPRLSGSEPARYVLRATFAFVEPASRGDQYHRDGRLPPGPW